MAGGSFAAVTVRKERADQYQGKVTSYVIIACLVAAIGGSIFGYDIGISGGVTSMDEFLREFFHSVYEKKKLAHESNYCKYDDQGLAAFTSSLYLAGLVATLVASPITRNYGRRASIICGGISFFIGAALNAGAVNLLMLLLGRIMLGVGIGFGNQAVPLYLSEVAPTHLRGGLNIMFQLATTLGIFTANMINFGTQKLKPWGWRLSLGLAAFPALLMTIGGVFLPETPNSLIERGLREKGRGVLEKLRGTSNVDAELQDMIDASELANSIKHPFRNILFIQNIIIMYNIVWCNIAIFLMVNAIVLEALQHVDVPNKIKNQPYRTGFHFQPPKNWMNDPNGPMIYKGVYHLFYQWSPNDAVMKVNEIVWGHATSTDLINWAPLPPAIKPSRPSDINGCWSGSVTILPNGKPVILYTGNNHQNHQVQNLAIPKNLSDPNLRHWTKSPINPLLTPNTVNEINSSAFRDPTTAWLGRNGRWRITIGSQEGRRGLALLYTSRDFIKWQQSPTPLHYNDGSGMWECPDFFPVARFGSRGLDTSSFGDPMEVKYVLKVSLSDTMHDYYTIGTYHRVRDIYVPDNGFVQDGTAPRYDYGKFYASKTFYDSVMRRRILWGWVNESSPEKDNIEKGWAGLQAIPRKLWLDESGKRLIQWPVKEIERLRTKQVKWFDKVLPGKSVIEVHGVTASQADVEVLFKVRDLEKADVIKPGWTDPQLICSQKKNTMSVKSGLGPFGLMVLASKNMEEYTSVYIRIFKAHENSNDEYVVVMCSDQSRSSLEKDNDKTTYGAFLDISPQKPISLRTLIDHSIVESFGGKGKACITSRVYPKLAIEESSHLFVFNNGTQSVDVLSLSAWSMRSSV